MPGQVMSGQFMPGQVMPCQVSEGGGAQCDAVELPRPRVGELMLLHPCQSLVGLDVPARAGRGGGGVGGGGVRAGSVGGGGVGGGGVGGGGMGGRGSKWFDCEVCRVRVVG
jgi:hypothetical protein